MDGCLTTVRRNEAKGRKVGSVSIEFESDWVTGDQNQDGCGYDDDAMVVKVATMDMREKYLLGHDGPRRNMFHLLHTATVTLTQFLHILQVFVPQVMVFVFRVHIQVGQGGGECRVVVHAL